MKQTCYLTTTIQAGNRLEIDLPNFPIGQTVEVIIITEAYFCIQKNFQKIDG